MGRVIGMDIHRTFAEVVFWETGRLRPAGRVDMTRSGLEGFGRTLDKADEVVVEAEEPVAADVVRCVGEAGAEATRLVLGDVGVRIPLEARAVRSYADH